MKKLIRILLVTGSLLFLGLYLYKLSPLPSQSFARDNFLQNQDVNSETRKSLSQTMTSSSSLNPQLLSANQKFAFDLFEQIRQQKPEDNVFISPTSISLALMLLYNGADGSTQAQMSQALALQGMNLEQINSDYLALQNHLNSQTDAELAIANSIWIREGFEIKPEFKQQNQQYYNALVSALDFDKASALSEINGWVSNATNNKITSIINQTKPEDLLFLINAIYFKGVWHQEFDPQMTQESPFYYEQDNSVDVPFMTQKGNFSYLEQSDLQVVSLPYGEDKKMSMDIFLPSQESSLEQFLTQLNPDKFQALIDQLTTQKLDSLSLPKFQQEYDLSLNETLKAMGMNEMFTSEANLRNLTDLPIQVDQVKHKTFLEVNEQGSEAAAVTSVGVTVTSMPMNQKIMKVDRPFFYVIRDNQTGTILFMGVMQKPQTN